MSYTANDELQALDAIFPLLLKSAIKYGIFDKFKLCSVSVDQFLRGVYKLDIATTSDSTMVCLVIYDSILERHYSGKQALRDDLILPVATIENHKERFNVMYKHLMTLYFSQQPVPKWFTLFYRSATASSLVDADAIHYLRAMYNSWVVK